MLYKLYVVKSFPDSITTSSHEDIWKYLQNKYPHFTYWKRWRINSINFCSNQQEEKKRDAYFNILALVERKRKIVKKKLWIMNAFWAFHFILLIGWIGIHIWVKFMVFVNNDVNDLSDFQLNIYEKCTDKILC